MGRTVRVRQLRASQQECAATWRLVKRHVDPHPLFRASEYHRCRGLHLDRPPEGDNRGRHPAARL
jgi:hypothetical protein